MRHDKIDIHNQKGKGNTIPSECNKDSHILAVSMLYIIGLISNLLIHNTPPENMKSDFIQTLEQLTSKYQFKNNDERKNNSHRAV